MSVSDDYLVLGSHHEGQGHIAAEALPDQVVKMCACSLPYNVQTLWHKPTDQFGDSYNLLLYNVYILFQFELAVT